MKVLFLFTVVCLSFFFVVDSFYMCDVLDGNKIKLIRYSPTKEICCNHMLHIRTTNATCCGNKEIYFSHEKMCCGGKVRDKFTRKSENLVENICCGNQAMIEQTNIMCCENRKVQLNEDQVKDKKYLRCCRDKIMNVRTETCCGTSPIIKHPSIGCCGNKMYIKNDDKCVRNKKMRKTQMFCGNVLYDSLEDTCCHGQLIKDIPSVIEQNGFHHYNPDTNCCGKKVISRSEKCCQNYRYPAHSIPNKPELECCGNDYFNTSSQVCLGGITRQKQHGYVQCGNQLIDESYQACCANKLPYNVSTEKCCQGLSYCVINKGGSCCNGFGMSQNEVCCENIRPCPKTDTEDDECCFNRITWKGKTYKKHQAVCNEGRVKKIPSKTSPCGYGHYYNPNEEFCCNRKVYNKEAGQCCGEFFRNTTVNKGRCCSKDKKVYGFDKDEANPCRRKCNTDFFDTSSEICCHGKVYNFTGQNYCCGTKVIDSTKQGCCGGHFPYRLSQKSKKHCCHNTQVYNSYYSRCTPKGTIEPKGILSRLTDGQRLCSSLALKSPDGLFQHACLRQYGISGRIVSVRKRTGKKSTDTIIIKVNKVKNLLRDKNSVSPIWSSTPKKMTFTVEVSNTSGDCRIINLQNLKRVLILFDLPDGKKVGRRVTISNTTSFFLTQRTFQRYYTVTTALSETSCKTFYL